jgi:ligand-binding SRPBCC domain-containing protein
MRQYSSCFRVQAPLGRVAEFHRDTKVLKHLTPPPLIVKFNELQPLAEGSVADFTIWIGPLPIRWVAIHSDVDPEIGFTDTQVAGAFEAWTHRHSFSALDGNSTEIRDEIKALPSRHPFWGLVSRFIWLNLPILFAYRAWRTRKALEQGINMTFDINQPAPEFTLEDYTGQPVNLSDYRHHKNVVLVFNRGFS